jgi:PST family polysaccharide transporter
LKGKAVHKSGRVSERNAELERDISRYAFPLMPLALVCWLSSLGDRYIVAGVVGLDQAGVYAAAYGLVSRPFLIAGSALCLTLRPLYFEAVSMDNRETARNVFTIWMGIGCFVCFIGVVGFFLLHDWIAKLLLAENFRTAAQLMPWIAAGYGLMTVAVVFENVLYANKKTRTVLVLQIAVALASVGLAYVGISRFGLLGAAMACPIYFAFHLALAFGLAKFTVRNDERRYRAPGVPQT